jgi:hypothetical protein
MRCVALCALAGGLALVAVGCGAGRDAGRQPTQPGAVSPIAVSGRPVAHAGPFGPGGDFASGGGSGLWGDGVSGPDGSHLGCIPGRLYAQAVTVQNIAKHAVTLTGASSRPKAAPQVITLVATQLSLAPPPLPPGDDRLVIILRHWSDARTRPVTIPAGRSAIVQRNFRMARCNDLAGGRTLVVPGELHLAYRTDGEIGTQTVAEQGSRIILTEGPTKLTCTRVLGGSSSIVAASTHCQVARKAAVACHPLSHGSWGMCTSNGTLWECARTAGHAGWALTETCYLPHDKSHWFRVRWKQAA